MAKLPSLAQALGKGGGAPTVSSVGSQKLPTLKQALSGNGGAVVVPAKKPQGGFIHGLEHAVSQTGSDLYHAAINAPAGLYYTGKGLATHPVATVKQMGSQVVQDFEHPLRHPGYTLLDIVGALDAGAGTGVRLAAAGRAAEAGATAAEVGRALVRHPGYGERTLRSGELAVHPETSRSAIGAGVQKASDKVLQQAADKNPAGRAASLVNRKIGKINTEDARTAEALAKGPGAALIKIGRKLSPGEQKALQVVAEQAPIEGRITATSARITGARDEAARGRHQAELGLLHEAMPHLAVADGVPSFVESDGKLAKVYAHMEKVAGDRETLLKNLGLLTDEAVGSRTSKAGRVALGQPVAHIDEHPPAIAGQMSMIDEPKPALFNAGADAVRIPDVATRAAKSHGSIGGIGAQGTVGHLKAPGSVSHEFTGALRENALRREDTTQLVGESSLEAAKYAGLAHIHSLVRQAVTDTPLRENDIAVRLDNLASHERTPLEVKKFLGNPDEYFQTHTQAEAISMFDKVRGSMFIDPKTLTGEDAAHFAKLHAEGKIGWVPKAILGDFAKPQAPLRAVLGSKPVRTVDAINNASRFAILYLKPAYAIPNLLGNAALTVLQQGWAAPSNLVRAARISHDLGPDLAARIDTAMGEGVAQSVSAHGQGALSGAVDKAAGVWSKGVDTPFRRSSFIYEARQAGYRTPQQMEQLLTDPGHHGRLVGVAQKANREAIDYGNLTPVEREVIRRVVFFFPWIKGSTTYAGRMLREHPIKSAAIGQIGAFGREKTQQDLGPVPSYLEGAFRVAGGLVNPNSAAILQTPAQVGLAAQGLLTGNIPQAAQAASFLTPAAEFALAEALRKNPQTGIGYKGGTNAGTIAKDVLGSSLPQVTLARDIQQARHGQGGNRLYPPTVQSAILKFLAGGLPPRPYSPSVLHRLSASERQKMASGR